VRKVHWQYLEGILLRNIQVMVTTKSLPFGHIQIINSRIHLVYTEMLTVKRQF